MSLELQQAYGAKLWKVKAAVLDGLNAQYAHKVAETKAEAEAINVKRKQDQVLNAEKLQTYRHKYMDLLDKTFSIKVGLSFSLSVHSDLDQYANADACLC